MKAAAPAPPQAEDDEIENGGDRQFVIALARGIRILRCFDATQRELGTREIAALTRLPQPTVWRLCHTLIELGCLAPTPRSDKLRVSAGILSLGQSSLVSNDLLKIIQRELQDFSDEARTSISLSVREGMEMRIVARAQATGTWLFHLAAGSRLPLGHTAAGWAVLSVLDSAERDRTVARLATTENDQTWPRLWRMASKVIADAHNTGYVVNRGYFQPEMCGIGVAFSAAEEVYAMSVGAPLKEMPEQRIEELVPKLKHLASVLRRAIHSDAKAEK